MKLNEWCKNYFHKGFVNFDYTSVDEGFCTVREYDGKMFKQFFSVEDGKVKFGSIKDIDPNIKVSEPIESLKLDSSVMVKMPISMKKEITNMAKIRGMAPSTYVRHLIEQDIIREREVNSKGYEIIDLGDE